MDKLRLHAADTAAQHSKQAINVTSPRGEATRSEFI